MRLFIEPSLDEDIHILPELVYGNKIPRMLPQRLQPFRPFCSCTASVAVKKLGKTVLDIHKRPLHDLRPGILDKRCTKLNLQVLQDRQRLMLPRLCTLPETTATDVMRQKLATVIGIDPIRDPIGLYPPPKRLQRGI